MRHVPSWMLGLLLCAFMAACVPQEDDTQPETGGDVLLTDEDRTSERLQREPVPDGAITLRGTIVGGGATCAQFRGDDGRQISLEGTGTNTFEIGERLEITGQFVSISRCMQGPGFVISNKTSLPSDP